MRQERYIATINAFCFFQRRTPLSVKCSLGWELSCVWKTGRNVACVTWPVDRLAEDETARLLFQL